MIKKYIVSEFGKRHLVKASNLDSSRYSEVIPVGDEIEHIDDIDFVPVVDEVTGETSTAVKLNEEKRAARLQAESERSQKAKAENEIKAKLLDLDLKSIRSLREYVAKLPDSPQYIKDYETQALAERDKLKAFK